jgi:hypothetical protein
MKAFLDEPWLASLNRWTRQENFRSEVTVDGCSGTSTKPVSSAR